MEKPHLKSHILVVDDENEIAQSLSDYLTKKGGFIVSFQPDGQEAIDYLRSTKINRESTKVDLVLLDLRMPNVSGFDVLKWIRNDQMLKQTSVVMLTAAAGSREIEEAYRLGADDYITKPYRPQELLRRINSILRTKRLESELKIQTEKLVTLNSFSRQIAISIEVSEILAFAADAGAALLEVEVSAVLFLEGGKLQVTTASGATIESLNVLAAEPYWENLLNSVMDNQEPIFVNFEIALSTSVKVKLNSFILAPLIVRGRSIGLILGLNKVDHQFSNNDLGLYTSLASNISESIENAWLFTRIRQRQREMLETRNFHETLLDSIPDSIYAINENWQVLIVNRSNAENFVTAPDKLIGAPCYQTFFNRSKPCEHCMVKHVIEEVEPRSWEVKSQLGRGDSPSYNWKIGAYPLADEKSNSLNTLVVWQNVSEQLELRNILQQQNEELKELDKRKSEFLSTVSHELRTPLMPVKAAIENMLSGMYGTLTKKQRNRLEIALASVNHEARLIDNLLDLVRIEEGRSPLIRNRENLIDIIKSVVQVLEYDSEKNGVKLWLDIPNEDLVIELDRDKIKQVLLNLIHNAIKFTPPDGQIVIHASKDDNQIRVNITDTGIGIPQNKLTSVFERFFQVDSSLTRRVGGTGIGLNIAKEYILLHDGKIWVESEEGLGSSFNFTLPIAQTKEDQVAK